jgi:hypothetical protein
VLHVCVGGGGSGRDPRTGQSLLAGVQLIENAGGMTVGDKNPPPTPPPLKLRAAEGGAVGGGALTGRLAVVAASGPAGTCGLGLAFSHFILLWSGGGLGFSD